MRAALVLVLVLLGCGGGKVLAPVHPDVAIDWRCSDINTIDHPCTNPDVETVGVGELVYIGATWEAVCRVRDTGVKSWGYHPEGCHEQPFTLHVRCEPACVLVGDRPMFETVGPAVVVVTLTPAHGEPYVKRLSLDVVEPDRGSVAVTCRNADQHEVACTNAAAATFCVTARADQRAYVPTNVRVNGSHYAAIAPSPGQIDLPSRPACHPVPQGAVDISVGSEHHVETFGAAAP